MLLKFLPLAIAATVLTGGVAAQWHGGPPPRLVEGRALLDFPRVKACADRAVPGGRMIGSEWDGDAFTYQIRYMRGREIVDVIVDARNCRIVGGRENM